MNSLSSRYIKMTALEGTFSATQNMISFSIPAGMKIDLSETTVCVDLQINTTTTNAENLPQYGSIPAGGDIYKMALIPNDAGNTNTVLPNVYYVKNADIRCEKVGAIENLRAVNTLRLALDIYSNDLETKQDEQYLGGAHSDGIGAMNGSPFRDLNTSGTILSRNRPAQLRIPLKHIFDVAHTPVWDTTKYGRTDIRLEMAFDKFNIVQTMGQADTNWTNAALGTYGALDPANAGGAVGAPGLNVTSFKTTKTYTHPEEECPFYVGQRLIFQYTITNGGNATVYSIANGNARERTITSIIFNNGDDNKLVIGWDNASPIALVNGDTMSALTCVGCNAASALLVYNKVELEMKQVSDPTPPSIEYTTYNTEEDSGFAATQTNINKQYTCEPSTDNLVVCAMPSAGGVQAMNPRTKINSSRITIDNKEETPEPVVGRNTVANNVGQANPLYYDRIDRTYFNMGDDLECLVEAQLGFNTSLQANPNQPASALLNPLPVKAQNKQVQLDIDYTAGEITQLNLYKRLVKQI